jgi:F-type H+-transporting ATPase subunit b
METLIVALALVIFLGLVVHLGGHRQLLGVIDGRADKVRAELAEAERLRKEAEKLLADFDARRKAAEREAEQIVAEAKAEAERIRIEQEARLSDFVARRTRLAEQKIAQAELSAAAEVRTAAADAAILAAETILRGKVGGAVGDDLLAKGLAEVRSRLN